MKLSSLSVPALLLAAGMAWAQSGMPPPGGPGGRPPGGPSIEQLTRDLALSADQATQVKAILEAQRAKMEAQRQQNREASRPSREEMQARRQQADAELTQQLSNVLDAEQLKKFEALRQQRRPMGPPPGAPPGP
jgi:Spy/CpxP family protein refolding chaperone